MSETKSVIDVCIAGTGSYLPEKVLTNEEIAEPDAALNRPGGRRR